MSEQSRIDQLESQVKYYQQREHFTREIASLERLSGSLVSLVDSIENILDSSLTIDAGVFATCNNLKALAVTAVFELNQEREGLELTRQSLRAWEAKLAEALRVSNLQITNLSNSKKPFSDEEFVEIQFQIQSLLN